MMPRERTRAKSQKYLRAVERIKANIDDNVKNLVWGASLDGHTLDYSLDGLRLLDRLNPHDQIIQSGGRLNKTMAYIGEGGFLGEVIVRNLGGEWVYPSFTRIMAFQVLSRIGMPISLRGFVLFPKIQVKLKGILIPVMRIGRLRLVWSKKVFSLEKAYEEIRMTGKWTGETPLTKLEAYILKDKKWMRGVDRRMWFYDPLKHNVHSHKQFIRRMKIAREMTRYSKWGGGTEYSQDGLRLIDDVFVKKTINDILKEKEIDGTIGDEHEKKMLRIEIYRGVGSYLGETIVRHLGGEWKYPSNEDFLDAFKSEKNIEYLHDRTFVRLGEQLIPVMTIARMKLEDEISSLAEVYEKIRTTGDWK